MRRFPVFEEFPEEEFISGEEARELRRLVAKTVRTERTRSEKPAGYPAVWRELNEFTGVETYKKTKKEDFEKAAGFLKKWIAEGRPQTGARSAATRRACYAAINIYKNALGWNEEFYRFYLRERYGRKSIRRLTLIELRKLKNELAGILTGEKQ